jgi:phage-related protein
MPPRSPPQCWTSGKTDFQSPDLRGELYEVRAEGADASYRLLFAEEGAKGRILLALHAFTKKTQRPPPQAIALAARRLADWRSRSSQ